MSENYIQAQCEAKQLAKPSPRETLIDSKRRLEEKLVQLNEAIDFLDENPDFEKGMTLLNRALRY